MDTGGWPVASPDSSKVVTEGQDALEADVFGCIQDFNANDSPALIEVEDDVLGHPPVLDLLLALFEADIQQIDSLPGLCSTP